MSARAYLPSWGANMRAEGGARFRLWAPSVASVTLRFEGENLPMQSSGEGWFELAVPSAAPDAAYSFILPDGAAVPDPAARAQVADVHGPSRLVDPAAYEWRTPWGGRPWEEAVIAEIHIGTFTPAGTFAAAAEKLAHLAQTGITAVELLPVAQFSGNRGWGYDGVLPYAPHSAYGSPEELKAFVDTAHRHGLMVFLDVVYNHFGPDGNYLHLYAEDFFDPSRHTPWGAAIAYERPPVRDFFIENALYWLIEFNLDGLRLDAIAEIHDPSEPGILVELAQRVRAGITDRPIHLMTEDDRNITHLHERGPDGAVPLYTAEWNDDMHNAAHALATHEVAGYYADFADAAPLLGRALAEGFAYQGEPSPQTGQPRGQPSAHLPPIAFVDFLQNHDQIGNRAFGERLTTLTSPQMLRALRVILLLSPHIPLLFMGEEYDETRPFLFFTDFHGDLADAVRQGRRREFADFPAFAQNGASVADIPDPNAPQTFATSRLDWDLCARPQGQAALALTRELLALRRDHLVPRLAGARSGTCLLAQDGAIAVDWPVAGGLWQLRANLSDRPQQLPPAEGRLIHATHGPGDPAPGYFAAVSLSDRQGAP